ncbi:MAG: DUF4058 family protein [Chloroflexota bacterium]
MPHYSPTYVEHLKKGPFPGHVDPWAEAAHYFQQIHSSIIDGLIAQCSSVLLEMGYMVGREASLQIVGGREPDIFVQYAMNTPKPPIKWDYETAAAEVLAEPGFALAAEVELDALHIHSQETGQLVTVVELISPGNKESPDAMLDYRSRREDLLLNKHVNVVEIDLTRSVKRLVLHKSVHRYSYHIAVFLPGYDPRLIGMNYREAFKRFALPLRGEVIPLETQVAYDGAYQLLTVAAQLDHNKGYRDSEMPFPSLMTTEQHTEALRAVDVWSKELERLRGESSNG